MEGITVVKEMLKSEFDMKDLGEATVILGMEINRDRSAGSIVLHQSSYIEKVLKRYNMDQSKAVTTPVKQGMSLSAQQSAKTSAEILEMERIPYANAVGSLMYAMVCCRPDLAHAMSFVSRFMGNPGRDHWEAVKWIQRYIRGSLATGLYFNKFTSNIEFLAGYVDADYAANLDTRKSLSGYVFCLFGTAVSWRSTHQSVVALSTTEAEFISLTEAVKEGLWLQEILSEFGVIQGSVLLHCDNSSAIHLSRHQGYYERTKHIDVRMYFVRDLVEDGKIVVKKIETAKNPADFLTKALPSSKFELCKSLINVC